MMTLNPTKSSSYSSYGESTFPPPPPPTMEFFHPQQQMTTTSPANHTHNKNAHTNLTDQHGAYNPHHGSLPHSHSVTGNSLVPGSAPTTTTGMEVSESVENCSFFSFLTDSIADYNPGHHQLSSSPPNVPIQDHIFHYEYNHALCTKGSHQGMFLRINPDGLVTQHCLHGRYNMFHNGNMNLFFPKFYLIHNEITEREQQQQQADDDDGLDDDDDGKPRNRFSPLRGGIPCDFIHASHYNYENYVVDGYLLGLSKSKIIFYPPVTEGEINPTGTILSALFDVQDMNWAYTSETGSAKNPFCYGPVYLFLCEEESGESLNFTTEMLSSGLEYYVKNSYFQYSSAFILYNEIRQLVSKNLHESIFKSCANLWKDPRSLSDLPSKYNNHHQLLSANDIPVEDRIVSAVLSDISKFMNDRSLHEWVYRTFRENFDQVPLRNVQASFVHKLLDIFILSDLGRQFLLDECNSKCTLHMGTVDMDLSPLFRFDQFSTSTPREIKDVTAANNNSNATTTATMINGGNGILGMMNPLPPPPESMVLSIPPPPLPSVIQDPNAVDSSSVNSANGVNSSPSPSPSMPVAVSPPGIFNGLASLFGQTIGDDDTWLKNLKNNNHNDAMNSHTPAPYRQYNFPPSPPLSQDQSSYFREREGFTSEPSLRIGGYDTGGRSSISHSSPSVINTTTTNETEIATRRDNTSRSLSLSPSSSRTSTGGIIDPLSPPSSLASTTTTTTTGRKPFLLSTSLTSVSSPIHKPPTPSRRTPRFFRKNSDPSNTSRSSRLSPLSSPPLSQKTITTTTTTPEVEGENKETPLTTNVVTEESKSPPSPPLVHPPPTSPSTSLSSSSSTTTTINQQQQQQQSDDGNSTIALSETLSNNEDDDLMQIEPKKEEPSQLPLEDHQSTTEQQAESGSTTIIPNDNKPHASPPSPLITVPNDDDDETMNERESCLEKEPSAVTIRTTTMSDDKEEHTDDVEMDKLFAYLCHKYSIKYGISLRGIFVEGVLQRSSRADPNLRSFLNHLHKSYANVDSLPEEERMELLFIRDQFIKEFSVSPVVVHN